MRVAIIAEQNFNLIDGSTIWLLNACKLLDLQPDLDVTLLLRTPLSNWVLANELPARIKVRDHRILKDHSLSEPDLLTARRVPDTLIALQSTGKDIIALYNRSRIGSCQRSTARERGFESKACGNGSP